MGLITTRFYHIKSKVKTAKGGGQMSSVKSRVIVFEETKAWQENSFFVGAGFY